MPEREINKPPTFQDSAGHAWTIRLTLDLLDKVLESSQIDLIPDDMDVQPVIGLLFRNRELGKVLWTCIETQAKEEGIERSEFLKTCDSETLTAGWGALVDAVVFFTRSKNEKLGEALAETVEAQMQLIEAGAIQLQATLKDPETQKMMQNSANSLGKLMREEIGKAGQQPVRRARVFGN